MAHSTPADAASTKLSPDAPPDGKGTATLHGDGSPVVRPPEPESDAPIGWAQVLREELDIIQPPLWKPPPAATERELLKSIHRLTGDGALTALCLSGGGIRSATFCLGVLQALGQNGLLKQFDYLSTVSGGGYIGSWFKAWIHRKRATATGPEEARDRVIQALTSRTDDDAKREPPQIRWLRQFSNYLSPRPGLLSADTWTIIATYLRNLMLNWFALVPFFFALLLFPRMSVASARLSMSNPQWWTVWLVAGFILAIIAIAATRVSLPSSRRGWAPSESPGAALAPGAKQGQVNVWDPADSLRGFLIWVLIPLCLAAIFVASVWATWRNRNQADPLDLLGDKAAFFVVAGAGLHFIGSLLATAWLWFLKRRQIRAPQAAAATATGNQSRPSTWVEEIPDWLKMQTLTLVVGGLAGLSIFLVARTVIPAQEPELYSLLASPVLLSLFLVMGSVFVAIAADPGTGRSLTLGEFSVASVGALVAGLGVYGLAVRLIRPPEPVLNFFLSILGLVGGYLATGFVLVWQRKRPAESRGLQDDDIEWAARCGSWVLIFVIVWLFVAGLVIYGPMLFDGKIMAPIVAAVGAVAGAVTTWLGWIGPSSSATDGTTRTWSSKLKRKLPIIAAPIFVAFLVVLLSLLTSWILGFIPEGLDGNVTDADPKRLPFHSLGPANHFWVVRHSDIVALVIACFILFVLLAVLVRVISLNRFSLHAMYRTRLIRAYLGASNDARTSTANRITGTDDGDDFPIGELREPPFHVVNVALNVVGGKELAWQERKARSFTLSALHAGSRGLGYRRTSRVGSTPAYGGVHGVTLGTAMAISGAAANPNMGYHSSPMVTLLMTLFNVRLGWWLGNPGRSKSAAYSRSSPPGGFLPVLFEAFGRTDDTADYVHLSDGGHFDNLGLYEMVLRRCRYIVVVDASCDPKSGFGDMGNAIRKIRIDLGISINFTPPMQAAPQSDGGITAVSGVQPYFRIGYVKYSAVDGPNESGKQVLDGLILYFKPSSWPEGPQDALSYGVESEAFPHESTVDQFFTESQFESYRALGYAAALQITTEDSGTIPALFSSLTSNAGTR